MNKKTVRLIAIYAVAAIIALGIYSTILSQRLESYRRSALYSSRQAFEETVRAAEGLSVALKKSGYATDGCMCVKLCAEAYSAALSAEAALSILPFSTQQLEQSAAFLNTAGNYAQGLCTSAASDGFTSEQIEQMADLSEDAESYADMLRQLQSALNNGLAVMDSEEELLQNIGLDERAKLSGELLNYEESYEFEALTYDGKFTARQEGSGGTMSEEEALVVAAKAAGLQERELKEEHEYAGDDGRRCYSAGGLLLCVSSKGLESMAQSRLLSQGRISEEKAGEIADRFLERMGYEGLVCTSSVADNALMNRRYSVLSGDAVCLDNYIDISLALDDGSIFMFNALSFDPKQETYEWSVSEEQAKEKLAEGLTLSSSGKVIIKSEGGRDLPCYEFKCVGQEGEEVTVYVDGSSGKQHRIDIQT